MAAKPFSEYSLSEAREFTLGIIKGARKYSEGIVEEVDLIYHLQETEHAFAPFWGKYQTLYNDIVDARRVTNMERIFGSLDFLEDRARELIYPQNVLNLAANVRPLLAGHQVYETRNLLDEFAYPARLKRTSTRSLAAITQALIKANGDPVKAATALLR